MKTPLVEGVATMLCTPFHPGGSPNLGEFCRLIDDQLNAGVDAVVVGGTAGEGPTLEEGELKALIRAAVRECQGRERVLAATGCSGTGQTIRRSRMACDAGADGVLVVGPYYNRTTRQGLAEHFLLIADQVPKPVILSNIPPAPGFRWTGISTRRWDGTPISTGQRR